MCLVLYTALFSLGCSHGGTQAIQETHAGVEETPRARSPLSGIPLAEPGLGGRRALAVKVENAPQARPQSGLDRAEVVYEVCVEGGLTRFIALYLSLPAQEIGPVRSLRPTDAFLLRCIDPLIAASGASPQVTEILRAHGMRFLIEREGKSFFWRSRERRAPHNLYTSTLLLEEALRERGEEPYRWTRDLFLFGEPPEGEEALEIRIAYPSPCAVIYRYDRSTSTYLREVGGLPHLDKVSCVQLAPTTVIVLRVTYEDLGVRDMAGELSPDCRALGSGEALLFCNGRAIPCRWAREDLEEPARLLLPSGEKVSIPSGQVWVHLLPQNIRVTYGSG